MGGRTTINSDGAMTADSKRYLIINADDLGYTHALNRTIAACHRAGVVRSTSLMANGGAFADAVATVKDLPGLGVGVHLVLTELLPVASPQELPGLVDGQGKLPPTPSSLFRAVLARRVTRQVLEVELERQIQKVIDAGVRPTHLDTHKHVHVLPGILEAIIGVAARFGIHWLRNPFDETSLWSLFMPVTKGQRSVLCRQFMKTRGFSLFRSEFRRRLLRAGLDSPNHFFGTAITGIWNEAILSRMVSWLPSGINELMTHPGECDADLRRQSTRLLESREQERDILIAPAFRNLLRSQEIVLTHYGEIAR